MSSDGYGSREYWERLYAGSDGATDEWIQSWPALAAIVDAHVPRDARVLHVGCGNSLLGEAMYDAGWREILNIDYAPSVIEQMRARAAQRPGLEYRVMDVLALDLPDASMGAVIEKGTLDAVACRDDGEEAFDRACAELHRVLRPGGVFLSISMRAPWSRQARLERPALGWRAEAIAIAKQRVVEGLHPDLANNWVYVMRR